jgi:hypothetical protein
MVRVQQEVGWTRYTHLAESPGATRTGEVFPGKRFQGEGWEEELVVLAKGQGCQARFYPTRCSQSGNLENPVLNRNLKVINKYLCLDLSASCCPSHLTCLFITLGRQAR